jgi:hypothetical protein
MARRVLERRKQAFAMLKNTNNEQPLRLVYQLLGRASADTDQVIYKQMRILNRLLSGAPIFGLGGGGYAVLPVHFSHVHTGTFPKHIFYVVQGDRTAANAWSLGRRAE